MYNKLVSIIAAAMLTLSAGSAFASLSFQDNELFRVVYDNSGIKQTADLGNVDNMMSGGSSIIPGGINYQNAGSLSVCYFALDRNKSALWVSGTGNAPTAATDGFNNLANGFDNAILQLLARAVNGVTGTSLASLVNGSAAQVSQTLYYINDANAAGTPGIGKATIITSNSGDTVVIPTPIPPAFLLMSSGLLGLFGLHRNNDIS